jgi:hypothetical protein
MVIIVLRYPLPVFIFHGADPGIKSGVSPLLLLDELLGVIKIKQIHFSSFH